MAFNVFFDTNIIVDFLDPLRPFHHESIRLFTLLERGIFKAYYSESVVTTTAYVIRKDYPKNEICEIIANLNKKILLVPCNAENIFNATAKFPPDFEDGLLYEIALHRQLDYFITCNTKDFKRIQNEMLPVINSKEFNKLLAVDSN
jgi:predicted nucleic acid-binding protein